MQTAPDRLTKRHMRLMRAFLWSAVVGWAIGFGAKLFDLVVVAGAWSSSPPASFALLPYGKHYPINPNSILADDSPVIWHSHWAYYGDRYGVGPSRASVARLRFIPRRLNRDRFHRICASAQSWRTHQKALRNEPTISIRGFAIRSRLPN